MPSLVTRNLRRARVAVLLLAQPREDAADGLGERQQFFFGHELVEQLGLVRHGAEAAADVELEAALDLPSTRASRRCRRGRAVVTSAAGLSLAAGEGDLELAAEVLDRDGPSRKYAHGLGVRRDVEGLGRGRRRRSGRR